MTRTWLTLMLIGLVPGLGCGARGQVATSRVVVFVPGVGGDGPWYGGLKRGLGNVQVQTHSWGAPLPLFALNFSNQEIHNAAEKKLAERLRRIARQQPDARIDVVAHSAGCGVALGALRRFDGPIPRTVVLLAPSVS